MSACFDLLNTGRPLLPPTLDFVNSNLSSNPFKMKGLQLYENILTEFKQPFIKLVRQLYVPYTSIAQDPEILGLC